METGNRNWKLKTEMETQPPSCCSHSNVVGLRSHNLLHTLQAIKAGSGSRNKAARVGMLALFQNEVVYSYGQIATSLVPRPSHM